MTEVRDIAEAMGVEPVAGPDGPQWWVRDGATDLAGVARRLGLREVRRLHQMRRPLPIDPALGGPPLALRAFVPGVDDEAWLRTNNRAFAWHPDQGGWTAERLAAELAAPWFEAEGFLVLDGPDGSIAGFCWTKHHPDADPPMGEIYVIGVDPDLQGSGAGRALTVAGLAWQWDHHRPPVGMLYVEHDNAAAMSLYRRLGFTTHHDDVAFELPRPAAAGDGRG